MCLTSFSPSVICNVLLPSNVSLHFVRCLKCLFSWSLFHSVCLFFVSHMSPFCLVRLSSLVTLLCFFFLPSHVLTPLSVSTCFHFPCVPTFSPASPPTFSSLSLSFECVPLPFHCFSCLSFWSPVLSPVVCLCLFSICHVSLYLL